MIKEEVILVDKNNNEIGVEEKLKAHREGKLHRAFSILVFNSKGELLLQRRAKEKYHWGGIWANTCCSHPRPNETHEQATHRRLKEEMGFDCELKESSSFIYRSEFSNGLIENEHDTIFIGNYDGEIKPNSSEVMDYCWISPDNLKSKIKENPDDYSPWLKIILEKDF